MTIPPLEAHAVSRGTSMKLYQPLPTHIFIHMLLFEDREIFRIIDSWKLDREEIRTILVAYYHALGVVVISPNDFARFLREDVLMQLKHNPVFLETKKIARP